MNDGISIIIPAHNEEKNITDAVESVEKALKPVKNWEIIIVNDGSTDSTKEIIEQLKSKNPGIKAIHFKSNSGIGMVWRKGIEKASKTYTGGFPGDNDMASRSLLKLVGERKEADIIISYMSNPEVRSLRRRIISRTYVLLMNLLCNLNLRYYNGYFIARTKLLKKLKLESAGFSIFAEIIAKMIKNGATYKEIPFTHTGRRFGSTSSVTLKSIWQSFIMAFRIGRDVR